MKRNLLNALLILVAFMFINMRVVFAETDTDINNNNGVVDDNNDNNVIDDNDNNINNNGINNSPNDDNYDNDTDNTTENDANDLDDDDDDNDMVENLSYGLGGLVIGGIVTYFIARRRDIH